MKGGMQFLYYIRNISLKNGRLSYRVVKQGIGDFGKWWGREVVRNGSGDEGSGGEENAVNIL